ncbi:MAG: helix-turn-helix transcriptional regulator [Oscillospiraceae bacterium]|nr:helix-turn-helix transcriptional regulator [Oscillospiraceae bacterium]
MNDNISVNEKESMGSIIRRLRMERDWTQEELAARLNVSGQAVSKWETGQSLPDISQVPQLARTLGVTTDELFGMEEQRNDFPLFDQGADPEKAWETWQEMREKIKEYEGFDGNIFCYVYAGYLLCCPDSLLYQPEHAAEVREETLRYAESRAKRMENSHPVGYQFRNLLMELYALSGNEKKAMEVVVKTAPFLTSTGMNLATIYHDMGRWEAEANMLTEVGTSLVNRLLDNLALCAEAALKLGWAEEALDAVEFGAQLIGILRGAAGARRDMGNLCQLGARALLALGRREEAMKWLEQLQKEPTKPGALVRRVFYVGRVGGTPVYPALRRAYLLRALDHPDLAPLRDDPAFQTIRERVEAITEEG